MAASSSYGVRAQKTSSRTPHDSYQSFAGIEKTSIGVGMVLRLDLPQHVHIQNLLAASGVLSVIPDDCSSTDFVREFYNNLYDPSETELNGGVMSMMQYEMVQITHEDLRTEFGFVESENRLDVVEKYRAERDWTQVNLFWHGKDSREQITDISSLREDAFIIQDILHNTIMLKFGETKKITAQLIIVTYHILQEEVFDVADLLLSMMRHTFKLKDPKRSRLNTLPLGGLIQRVVMQKYQYISRENYINDLIPTLYPTSSIQVPRPRDVPSSSSRPPLRRGVSLRETSREHQESFEEFRENVTSRMSRMEKMMRYMIKALKLKPTPTEEREWDVPVEDPPRHSTRRTRRSRDRLKRTNVTYL